MTYTLGIDIGGTTTHAIAVSTEGSVLTRASTETKDEDDARWRENIRSLHEQVVSERGAPPDCTGLAAPGLANREASAIAWMPGRLQGLENLDWTEYLGSKVSVRVLNDAHAALLGEVWQGAARKATNAVLLTLGTGVGGAILSEGKLLRGSIGRAGHFGHISLDWRGKPDICGTPGSLEDIVGEWALGDRSDGRFTRTTDLVDAHLRGDEFASEVWLQSVKALAVGIASITNAVDPEVVLLSGGIAQAGDALFTPLREYLNTFEWRPGGHGVRVLPAQLKDWAGAYGAAYFALHIDTLTVRS